MSGPSVAQASIVIEKIVENLGAMVRELDRSLVPEIEAAVGPSPEWYQPEG